MSCRTNPNKIPATVADVNRAKRDATSVAINHCLKMVLYILLDKHNAPADDVQQLGDEIGWLARCISDGRISWNDVDKVLDEYNIKIRLV